MQIMTFVQYMRVCSMNIKPTDFVGSLAKGISVIEAFSDGNPKLSIADVSKATGLDRAAARRHLLTLHALGYADYDGKFFSLTLKLLNLSSRFMSNMSMTAVIQPLIDSLSKQTGESASIALLDGVDVVCASTASQRRVLSIGLVPGSRLPAFCTAMGRILLSGNPETEVLAVLKQSDIRAFTPQTLTNKNEIMAEIKLGIEQGYNLVDQEFELGLRSLAVPVLSRNDEVIAALNIGVAAAQVSIDALISTYLPRMLACPAELRVVIQSQRLSVDI